MKPFDVLLRSHDGGLLAQGNEPAARQELLSVRPAFDVLILCAEELEEDFRHIVSARGPSSQDVVFASYGDEALTRRALSIAIRGAAEAVASYRRGRRVLVTCHEGRNRSGLVSALALHEIRGCGGREAAQIVQELRPGSLTNEHYVKFLRAIAPMHLRPTFRGYQPLRRT